MISTVAGVVFSGCSSADNLSSRLSGTAIIPMFGSMVQKGKLTALAPALVSALNKVDLPTLGSPTIPHLSAMPSHFLMKEQIYLNSILVM